jgi:mannose-1-phosphate guanylyltransferase
MATGSEQHVVVVIMVAAPPKVGTAARSAHPFGETPHIAANPHAWRATLSGAGTRFRPLSLNVPKPLFLLADRPMVHHPISACR